MNPARDSYPIRQIKEKDLPPLLSEIPDPPEKLYVRGEIIFPDHIPLAVVGSRKHTAYGKDVAESLIRGLRGAPILIISGLALGIDSIAHKAALDAGLPTIAVPGSGLGWDVLYPPSHRRLGEEILTAGGGLLSEFIPDFQAAPWSFLKRNRIMAGLSQAVLIIEAAERSGSLVTARMAMEYNRDVLAVPGPITSLPSSGTNTLIRDGATPILSSDDIREALGLPRSEGATTTAPKDLSPHAEILLSALTGPTDRDTLFTYTSLSPQDGNIALLELEMQGLIRHSGGMIVRA